MFQHAIHGTLGHHGRGCQVDGDYAVPQGSIGVARWIEPVHDATAIHHIVDLAKHLLGLLEHIVQGFIRGDVDLERQDAFGIGSGYLVLEIRDQLVVDVANDDIGALS